MSRHRFLPTIILAVMATFSPVLCFGNSEMRDWKLTSGEVVRAEIEKVDEAAGTVSLRRENKSELVIKSDDLSTLDRAWLLEWVETAEELEAKVAALGGRIEHYQGKGATTVTDFYVYHPSGAAPEGKKRPMMILFDPSGKGRRYLLRHMEGAEEAKITIVACDVFRNNMDGTLRFRELFPIIQSTVPHDPAQVFLGGTSGGAQRAFNLSALVQQYTWAGIYSNGGWLGGEDYWDLPYPSNMRVAMVNGDKDDAAEHYREPETKILQQRGITISVLAFEGGHQIPPASVQAKAFKWLTGQIQ